MFVEIRSSQIRTDMAELYRLVRATLQQEHLQSIADSPAIEISEDAL